MRQTDKKRTGLEAGGERSLEGARKVSGFCWLLVCLFVCCEKYLKRRNCWLWLRTLEVSLQGTEDLVGQNSSHHDTRKEQEREGACFSSCCLFTPVALVWDDVTRVQNDGSFYFSKPSLERPSQTHSKGCLSDLLGTSQCNQVVSKTCSSKRKDEGDKRLTKAIGKLWRLLNWESICLRNGRTWL